ncbi:CRISPR-associated helicase Cas3' [Catenibacterium mitsuokai]|uniref:CRISPR-associated helicase Cas3' n=1 Tax=Catenibacterium mitsuokai TaxID=100886 RepID=UPI003D76A7F8
MYKEYIAHISKQKEQEEQRLQTVYEHSENVSRYAELEAKRVKLGNTLKIAGLLHDVGKLTDEFNDYIHKAAKNPKSVKRGSVNHSSAGAKYIMAYGAEHGIKYSPQMIAYSIFSHHGLNDCVDESEKDKFTPRLNVDENRYQSVLNNIGPLIDTVDLKSLLEESEKEFKAFIEKINNVAKDMKSEDKKNCCFLVGCLERLILSYLVDADRRDTAEFMHNKIYKRKKQEEIHGLWVDYQKKLNQKLDSFNTDTKIDMLRKQMSDYCFDFAEKGNGIYRLSIPTGGGKTLSSMRYALELAKKENKEHIIYVAPFLSVLEQNADEIKTILKDDENILEHHSNVSIDENNIEELSRHELLADDWSAPVIMTTTVQFLNTLFDGSMQSVRRLHQLTNAVIIIDEAQSIPIKCLNLFTTFMNFLSYCGNSTIVMCTATQPLFEKINRPLLYNEKCKDMIPNIEFFSNEFKRVHIERPNQNKYNYESLAHFILDKMDQNILIVLNTKGAVRGVYREIKKLVNDDVDVIQLTTYMCAQHRLDIIDGMKQSLLKRKTICISTQLIEAGVNISFQTVIRSISGLDSIIQTSGRCNRNGESIDGIVYMVDLEENTKVLGDIHDSINATKSVLDKYQGDLLMPDAINKYYDIYYYGIMHEKNINCPMDYCLNNNLATKTLFEFLSTNRRPTGYRYLLSQAFKYAGKNFNVIERGNTVGLITQYGEAEGIVEKMLKNSGDLDFVKKCLKKLQRYTVNVYQRDVRLEELENHHGIIQFDEDILILDKGFYTKEGLSTELSLEVF